ncbi:hypothetical protein SISNIDRAFT_546590 [Sistotremastrum niveocremeum HHB9708]|uniref:VanZ-like domain-containing protein n=1 Tax=Sistotremastrum niveocremeum HHB9708 TaxID=1314777 RepID=A0A165AA39_9AGAM|nr:hypothetical protein SISNIDRAFT_546590 [Sistotremastrum niveocremeum HHB9708]
MIRLSSDDAQDRFIRYVRSRPRRIGKAVMKSHKVPLPKYEYFPIRIRWWFAFFTAVVLLILAFLGFTDFSRSLPLNDKLLHFICLCIATAVLYWVFDVEESARRIWFWRHAGLIITAVVSLLFGGVMSEVVQSLLPYKEFQMGDVLANLTGSSIGLCISYYLERYYRRRREIQRLYRPIAASPMSSDDEGDATDVFLPRRQGAQKPNFVRGEAVQPRMGDVWDESVSREEIFGVGDDDDLDDDVRPGKRDATTPQIVVTPAPTHNVVESPSH